MSYVIKTLKRKVEEQEQELLKLRLEVAIAEDLVSKLVDQVESYIADEVGRRGHRAWWAEDEVVEVKYLSNSSCERGSR
jgi:hypothetical protein